MGKILFWNELKKILFQPVVIGFVVFCILLNATLILLVYHDEPSVEHIKAENIYTDLKADEIAQSYIMKYDVADKHAAHIINKYEKVQKAIDEKARNGDALDYYFGGQTPYMHHTLFGFVFLIMIAQVSLIGLFLGLFAMTYENIRGTEAIVYTTKIGRKIIRSKVNAMLVSILFISTVLIGISLMIFFLRFDFSGVWSDHVSSAFNLAVNESGKAFITWTSMTVMQYLWATIAVTIGLAICFGLIGLIAGVFVRNSYGAFLLPVIVLGGGYLLKYLLPIGSVGRAILGMTPVWLWQTSGQWFTDGGADIIWSHFEWKGLFTTLILLSFLIFIGGKLFNKKEIV